MPILSFSRLVSLDMSKSLVDRPETSTPFERKIKRADILKIGTASKSTQIPRFGPALGPANSKAKMINESLAESIDSSFGIKGNQPIIHQPGVLPRVIGGPLAPVRLFLTLPTVL